METLTPEQRIRWQSLLIALSALDTAGDEITLDMCPCGSIRIAGESGQVQWDGHRHVWAFDGADGSEMYV
jgi:hypothetical protein